MPRMTIKIARSDLTSKEDAKEFANDVGATLNSFNAKTREANLELYSLEHLNSVLEWLNQENIQTHGTIEFQDGTKAKHYVRKHKNFLDD